MMSLQTTYRGLFYKWGGAPGELNQLSIWILILGQVMISWFVGLVPMLGTQSLLEFSASLCPFPMCVLSFLSLKNKEINFKNKWGQSDPWK